jgi:protein ImuB
MYAVLHLPEFALQAVLRTEHEAPHRAAALFTDHTKKSVVVAANPRARAAGVEPGMTAPQAVARCPALLLRTANAAAETDARAALLAVGFTLSPTIEDTAPGLCTIELKGVNPSTYTRTASAALKQLEAFGFTATAGIAQTPLLALYAARAVSARKDDPMSVTDVPGRAVKESDGPSLFAAEASGNYGEGTPARRAGTPLHGISPVHPRLLLVTDPASFLAPLPLAAADPSPETAGVLSRWGLRTFGELSQLDRDAIGRRLGLEGLTLWDRTRGGTPRPLNPVVPAQAFGAALEFEDEIETLEPLLFILRRFLERLTLELQTSSLVAAELELTLRLSDDTTHQRAFRLPEPTADIEILFRTLHTHLDALRTVAPIIGLQLKATPTRPLVRQQGLFETGLRDPHGFAETLARVSAVVGAERVGTPRCLDSHRPDAVRLESPAPVIPPPAAAPVHPPLGLPLRRFRPPLSAQLELTAGRPTYLWTERFNGAVADVRGPWLSSGDWWQADRAWRRTEYDIALQGGGLYRLVYADHTWRIEGEYD